MRKISIIRMSLIVAVVACLLCAGMQLYSLNGESFDPSDTEMRVVVSGSMDGEPREEYDIETIPVGSMVFIHKVPEGPKYDFYHSLEIGDVVTFHYRNPVTRENMVVTHRIVDISDVNGDLEFTMAGDSIRDDPTNGSVQVVYASSDQMIGKVVGVSPTLGDLVIFLSSANGKAILIGLFASILAVIWVGPVIFKTFSKWESERMSRKERD